MAKTFEFKVTKTIPDDVTPQAFNDALLVLVSTADPKELITLSNAVKKNPGLIKKALKWL